MKNWSHNEFGAVEKFELHL